DFREVGHGTLKPVLYSPCGHAHPDACRLLACEGYNARAAAPHFFNEPVHLVKLWINFMIHPRSALRHIGEADAEMDKLRIFMRLIGARRDAHLINRLPEAIAWMRIVSAQSRRTA